jgi:hypothetical protein
MCTVVDLPETNYQLSLPSEAQCPMRPSLLLLLLWQLFFICHYLYLLLQLSSTLMMSRNERYDQTRSCPTLRLHYHQHHPVSSSLILYLDTLI